MNAILKFKNTSNGVINIVNGEQISDNIFKINYNARIINDIKIKITDITNGYILIEDIEIDGFSVHHYQILPNVSNRTFIANGVYNIKLRFSPVVHEYIMYLSQKVFIQ